MRFAVLALAAILSLGAVGASQAQAEHGAQISSSRDAKADYGKPANHNARGGGCVGGSGAGRY